MTREETLKIFTASGAFLEGHFQLTSGLHSPHYFQCAKVLQYPANAEKLCSEIVARFRPVGVDAVVAPALGGIVVGQEVGRQLNVRTMFAERKDRLMQLRRGFEIARGEKVLVCEDVITTGGSVKEVIEIVRRRGGVIAGIGAIVDRSGGRSELNDLFATLTMEVVTYKPAECPLCAQGLPVDKPGSRPGISPEPGDA
jgi:orotate phosphoribosyltransferase